VERRVAPKHYPSRCCFAEVALQHFFSKSNAVALRLQYNMPTGDGEQLTPMKLRERAGKTQRQVAEALGKTVGTVSDWERFVKRPRLSFSETKRLMEELNCTLEELIEAYERAESARSN
jgi:DNA-binding transcriptional regulator YiaG